MWANGMEPGVSTDVTACTATGCVIGAMNAPRVEPVSFSRGHEEEVFVEVHQVVRHLEGNLRADKIVGHLFGIEDGLIRRFDKGDASEVPLARVRRRCEVPCEIYPRLRRTSFRNAPPASAIASSVPVAGSGDDVTRLRFAVKTSLSPYWSNSPG